MELLQSTIVTVQLEEYCQYPKIPNSLSLFDNYLWGAKKLVFNGYIRDVNERLLSNGSRKWYWTDNEGNRCRILANSSNDFTVQARNFFADPNDIPDKIYSVMPSGIFLSTLND